MRRLRTWIPWVLVAVFLACFVWATGDQYQWGGVTTMHLQAQVVSVDSTLVVEDTVKGDFWEPDDSSHVSIEGNILLAVGRAEFGSATIDVDTLEIVGLAATSSMNVTASSIVVDIIAAYYHNTDTFLVERHRSGSPSDQYYSYQAWR